MSVCSPRLTNLFLLSGLAAAVVAAMLVLPSTAFALPAFPGAQGYGSDTPGGRGGAVIEVTSLDDSGPGTLRAALEDASGPRTVVFRVGGTITLEGPIQLRGESDSFVTVAGQTAPGDGIQIARYGLQIRDGAHDIVLRYLRIRPGDGSGDFQQDIDAVELWGNDGSTVHHVILDHCSLEWAMDENFSAWAHVTDVTVQRSLIAEALLDGQGHSVAKGVLVGAENADPKPDRFSFHHNLFAHNPDRNPRVAYALTDFRSNFVYDWGNNSSTMFGPYAGFPAGAAPTDVNLVANVFKRGPSSSATFLDAVWLSDNTRVFPLGNRGTSCPTGCPDEWDLGFREEFGGYDSADPATYRVATAFETPPVGTTPAADLAGVVLANVGASLPLRDAVDARIVGDALAGTGAIGRGSDYPNLVGASAPADGDHDGMPDDWELSRGLLPADPSDRNDDADADGYTELEEYLAEIGPSEFGCGDGTTHPGEACDDGNGIDGDGCDSNCTLTACGNAVLTAGESCDDGNLATGDCCDAACQFEAAATSCDDGEPCTNADGCDGAGTCVGSPTPLTDCLTAAKGTLSLGNGRFKWKWRNGSETTPADLGDPVAGGTAYALCLYDTDAGVSRLGLRASIPAGSQWWSEKASGTLKYRNRSSAPDGIVGVQLKPGLDGRAGLVVSGKGDALDLASLPLAQDPAVTVQLVHDGGKCWTQEFAAPARTSDAGQFKDSAD